MPLSVSKVATKNMEAILICYINVILWRSSHNTRKIIFPTGVIKDLRGNGFLESLEKVSQAKQKPKPTNVLAARDIIRSHRDFVQFRLKKLPRKFPYCCTPDWKRT